jgi:hypothetical protein
MCIDTRNQGRRPLCKGVALCRLGASRHDMGHRNAIKISRPMSASQEPEPAGVASSNGLQLLLWVISDARVENLDRNDRYLAVPGIRMNHDAPQKGERTCCAVS